MFPQAPLIVYGKDGPVFERVCPKCRRFIKFPKMMEWHRRFDETCEFPDVICSRCGPVNAGKLHIGWAGDYRE